MGKLFSFTILLFLLLGIWAAVDNINSIEFATFSKHEEITIHKPINTEVIVPKKQTYQFTVNGITLDTKKAEVEGKFGSPLRTTLNEYGLFWHAYHDNYENFFMVAYDFNNAVAALYTNQNIFESSVGIAYGTPKDFVSTILGEPLQSIQKGIIQYQFQEKRNFDMYKLDDKYVTIFYDEHLQHIVTGIQLVASHIEKEKEDYFVTPTELLKEGFELQMFDLVNATRVMHQLPILHLDHRASETARKHSSDMARHQYFSHTNLQGQDPFERMKADNISFVMAGENLAMGQYSSIFAHEGLMNSLGHRENILHPHFEHIGIGVAFDDQAQPYYTQKFFTK